ncbi:MAG TPA: DUF3107 domain-containing protein [Acidimicrobiia bacterium]
MDVRIGVLHCPKELTLEVETDGASLEKLVTDALHTEGGVLWLTDEHGRRVGVPAERLAYVELDDDAAKKRVGFGPA